MEGTETKTPSPTSNDSKLKRPLLPSSDESEVNLLKKRLRDAKSQYEKEIAMIQQRCTNLERVNNELEKEKEDLRNMYKNFEKVGQCINHEEEHNSEDFKKLEEIQKVEIENIKSNYEREIKRLKEEKDEAIKESKDFENKIQEMKSSLSSMKFDYENDTSSLRSELETAQEEIKSLQNTIQANKDEFNEELRNNRDKFAEMIEKEKNKITEEFKQKESTHAHQFDEVKNLAESEKKLLSEKLDNAVNVKEELEMKILELESSTNDNDSAEELRSLAERLKAKEDELKEVKRRAKEDIETLMRSESATKDKNASLTQDSAKLKSKLKKTEMKLEKTEMKLKNTQNEVTKNKGLKDEEKDHYNSLLNEIESLKIRNNALGRHNKCLEEDIKILHQEKKETIINLDKENHSLRSKWKEEIRKNSSMKETLEKQKVEMEKNKAKMTALQYNYQTKLSKKERELKELQQQRRVEESIKQERTINDIQKSGYGINASIHLRTTKSQLDLNDKTSETVLYGQYDDTTDNSIIETLNKKHKRRPSSLSSAERVVRTKNNDYNKKYDYQNNLEESYGSQNYMNTSPDIVYDDKNNDKDGFDYNEENEARQLSMSYLEDDYDNSVPKTHRDERNTSRPQQREDFNSVSFFSLKVKKTHQKENTCYKISPMVKNTSSTKNLKSGQIYDDCCPTAAGSAVKSKSIKKLGAHKSERVIDDFSPQNTGNYQYNYASEYTADMRFAKADEYEYDTLDATAEKIKDLSYDHDFNRNKKSKYPKYSKLNRDDVMNTIDSRCHNTFDTREIEDDRENGYNLDQRKDGGFSDFNNTLGDPYEAENKYKRQSNEKYSKEMIRRSHNRSKERNQDYDPYEEDNERSYSPNNYENYGQAYGKSRNPQKANFEKCQKLKTSDYSTQNMYTEQKSYREYRQEKNPKRESRLRRPDMNEHKVNQSSISKRDNYYPAEQEDNLFLNDEELPSKSIEKKLRYKSLENNRKSKRSRMNNYLQNIPQNRNTYDISPKESKKDQYRTHHVINIDDHMDQEYPSYHRADNHQRVRKEYGDKSLERYTTSPHIPQVPKEGKKRLQKSSSRNNIRRKPHRQQHESFQENVPENISKNRNTANNSTSRSNAGFKNEVIFDNKKYNEFKRVLKDQIGRSNEMENSKVDDTFTYSIDPESMFNSRVAPNGN
ncbi:unnamed protein product [Moneuplotes crassus]|uniref:Uncharacterized protein n=1 Tax=Euplotes crassus TaxID=5936 RepID=A0AAD1UQN4_EUPCR|nr:unnamed protein product [Moneuplotes crassus]